MNLALLQQVEIDLNCLDCAELRKIRRYILMRKLNATFPKIGHITIVSLLGAILRWIGFPPPPTLSWFALPLIWGAAWLICIAILSIPQCRHPDYKAHWINGD